MESEENIGFELDENRSRVTNIESYSIFTIQSIGIGRSGRLAGGPEITLRELLQPVVAFLAGDGQPVPYVRHEVRITPSVSGGILGAHGISGTGALEECTRRGDLEVGSVTRREIIVGPPFGRARIFVHECTGHPAMCGRGPDDDSGPGQTDTTGDGST